MSGSALIIRVVGGKDKNRRIRNEIIAWYFLNDTPLVPLATWFINRQYRTFILEIQIHKECIFAQKPTEGDKLIFIT